MSLFNTSHLAGKTVYITGASAGIGAATSELFAKSGIARLVLAARRLERLAEVKQRVEDASEGRVKVHLQKLDMQNKTEVLSAFKSLPKDFATVDVLINNAGLVLGREEVGDLDPDEVDTMVMTNVTGVVRLTNAYLQSVRESSGSSQGKITRPCHIFFLNSIAGKEAYVGGSVYCLTKHAIGAFATSLMKERVGDPVRVTQISPGMVETEFSVVRNRGDAEAAKKVYQGLQPLSGADIAEQIVFAASRPAHVQVADILIFPTAQASATINARV